MFLEEIKEINLDDVLSKKASEIEAFEKRKSFILGKSPKDIDRMYQEAIEYQKAIESNKENKNVNSQLYKYNKKTIEVIESIYLDGNNEPLNKKKGKMKDYSHLKVLGPIFKEYEIRRKIKKSFKYL